MKKLLILLPLTFAIVGCSPSISDKEQRQLDKAVSKLPIKFYKATKDSWTQGKLKSEKAQLVESIELTPEENDKVDKEKMAMASLGMKNVDFDPKKIIVKLEYKAPQDGYLIVNDSIFDSKALLDKFVAQNIKNKTHKRECIKYSSGSFGFYGRSCSKYKSVKVKGAEKIEKELRAKYASPKILKKGQVIKSSEYLAQIATVSVQGNSEAKVHLKKHKRKIASTK